MGDFSLPVTRWGNPLISHTGYDLYTNLLESELHQHVHEPTRVLNILDLILSTSKDIDRLTSWANKWQIKLTLINVRYYTSEEIMIMFSIQ